jgi:hypothetical protein
MSNADFSLIELPRTQPVDEPQAYLQAALRWHFSQETGSPYWLERAKTFQFNPLTDVKSFDDLALFPNIVDELRDVAVRDLVPTGYGPHATPTTCECGNDWPTQAGGVLAGLDGTTRRVAVGRLGRTGRAR